MVTQLEVVVAGAVGGQDPQGVPDRFEALHMLLASSGRLVKNFTSTVQILTLSMRASETQILLRRCV